MSERLDGVAVEFRPVVVPSFGQNLAAVTSTALIISAEALSVPSTSEMVGFAQPIESELTSIKPGSAPWWATALAVAGPMADGLSTVYAIRQSGPSARVVEGNGLYYKMFGADVKPGEIMAFKVAQAALMGAVVHFGGRQSRPMAISAAIAQAAMNFVVASQNMRTAAAAKRLNTGAR